MEELGASIDAILKTINDSLRGLNRDIWSNPETAYQEFKAHDVICDYLEEQGCKVTRHAYGLATSFEAISGSGGRLINFNAEYDALPGIGHACGHNLITTSSVAAFLALSAILKKDNIPGRIQLLGTPAEEKGGGKIQLIDAGAYNGVDVSLMAHACPRKLFPGVVSDGCGGVSMNASKQIHCNFIGKSAHAGATPWEGLNALDALVMSYNNVSMLRQQIQPDERIHCAFLDTPKVANIIPSNTKAYWQVRGPTLKGLNQLIARVRNGIAAGALAAGCEVEIDEKELYADIKIIDILCERYQTHMVKHGRTIIKRHENVLSGSTDAGNVSYVLPTLHAMFAIPGPDGSHPHHPSFAAVAGTDQAHKEAIAVGKSLALVGWEMITDNQLFEQARKQWEVCIQE
ncbi:M20 family metallopeptidase [Aspergillus ruber CBS 135680]|uniref:Peptidase M20 domain-containing protein 2 n=1 Tax=Aspergillus ruber (strain CBS 135680) TaxID=1388766 RepID=A0A017S2U4_ASPRC|nr:uncharacterized protein EURHEDRAFT_381138 [Aspergillus ruber CBS 135680]EYE91272.1 hypothetical protein EURHEDRAFT_381138 [Aspergillus ruber CBS 135680]